MNQKTATKRTFEDALYSISEIARNYLDEREIYGELRTDIKKRMAKIRLYIVNDLPEFLTNPEVIAQLRAISDNPKGKLTLDTIEALITLELGEDYDRYEAAKFNSETSAAAFEMFKTELSGFQSQIKKDAFERDNAEYAHRMTAQTN